MTNFTSILILMKIPRDQGEGRTLLKVEKSVFSSNVAQIMVKSHMSDKGLET